MVTEYVRPRTHAIEAVAGSSGASSHQSGRDAPAACFWTVVSFAAALHHELMEGRRRLDRWNSRSDKDKPGDGASA